MESEDRVRRAWNKLLYGTEFPGEHEKYKAERSFRKHLTGDPYASDDEVKRALNKRIYGTEILGEHEKYEFERKFRERLCKILDKKP